MDSCDQTEDVMEQIGTADINNYFDDMKPAKSCYVPPAIPTNEAELFAKPCQIGESFEAHKYYSLMFSGTNKPEPIKSLDDVQLMPIIKENLRKCNFNELTLIQSYAIPVLMKNRDLMACAETGSGKTEAYLIPIINDIVEKRLLFRQNTEKKQICRPSVLIVVPIRELATQIGLVASKIAFATGIKVSLLYGKTLVKSQIDNLRNANIVIATVGRLKHFLNWRLLDLSEMRYFVLDEAEKMLDLNCFNEEIRLVFRQIIEEKGNSPMFTTALFSATYSVQIRALASDFLRNQISVNIGKIDGSANKDINQKVLEVDRNEKMTLLKKILKSNPMKTIVFVDKKLTCDYVASQLEIEDFDVISHHGDKEQENREHGLRQFDNGTVQTLIATGVASRGLDIAAVDRVINYDLPHHIDEYIYRIGRTGRLGNKGVALTFYVPEDDSRMRAKLVQILTDSEQVVPEFLLDENLLWKKKKWAALQLNFNAGEFDFYRRQCCNNQIVDIKLWY